MLPGPTTELQDLLARGERAEGAGPAAAVVTAAASSLVALAARASLASWAEAAAAAAQAESLRKRAARLAQEDAEALDAYLALRREDAEAQRPEVRDFLIGQALLRAADVPLAIAEAACDVALLAAHATERCEGDFRPDAASAALLAHGAAQAAALLVEVNLATTPADARVTHARALVRAAATAASEAAQAAAS